jgi:hypothetical protein
LPCSHPDLRPGVTVFAVAEREAIHNRRVGRIVVFNEVTFVNSEPQDGAYEPLLGYIPLEQSRAAVDLVGHRLVPLKASDLKAFS